jgi:quercetin dioxygenase-like cupin family protein
MERFRSLAWIGCVVAVLFAAASAFGQGFVRTAPEQVRWVDEPGGHGVQRAVMSGDPSKPGLYVVRIKFPPGVMSTNHHHGEDRHIVVLQGTWYTGTGDAFVPGKTVPLKVGSYMKHPAGANHFDGAKDEEVILQIVGIGPSSTSRVNPKDTAFTRIP